MNDRCTQILQMFEQKDFYSVAALAEALDVSPMTIRRDLAYLEEARLVRRIHGGAVAVKMQGVEPEYHSRTNDSIAQKLAIAETAATLVRDNTVIAVDSGSTCLSFVKLIQNRKLTLVTCSLRVMEACLNSPGIKVIVPSGIMRSGEGSIYGSDAVKYLSRLHVNQFFMGIGGLDANAGLTDYSMEDASIKKTIIKNASSVIALVDSSKFNRITFSTICAAGDIDVLVTDSPPSDPHLNDIFAHSGVRVMLPEKKEEK